VKLNQKKFISNELVSIVIPSYNHGHLIFRALKSVIDQTHSNWEIIIIDNNSEDNTDEVLNDFKDSRIRIFKISNNGNIAVSRNMGIKNAKGEWVAFLDSDDWWYPNKLEECLKLIDKKTALIYHKLKIIREKKSILEPHVLRSRKLRKPIFVELMSNGNVIPNSSVMVRRSLLLEINCINEDPSMIGCEDYNAWLRIAQLSDEFIYIPKILGCYLLHTNGLSRKDMALPTRQATTGFKHLLNSVQLKKYESSIRYMKAGISYKAGNYVDAMENLKYCLSNASSRIRKRSAIMIIIIQLINVKNYFTKLWTGIK
jgi:glycosyltransferase involved in cell wall biosynthesis